VSDTLTGKTLEAPIKQILTGRRPEDGVSADAVGDFTAVLAFAAPADHAPRSRRPDRDVAQQHAP
jgi:hypothetical protein